jgi:L-threonine kinase
MSLATHRRARAGVSTAFGSFGELLQGGLPDGADFLVTLPIACWSTATFAAEPDVPGIRVDPPHKYKAVRLTRALLNATGYLGGGRLALSSALPEGKGLASSSADLVATARAIGNALGLPATPDLIERMLRPIEPTDGVMYDGVTVFEHREVRLRARLGSLPRATLVALDVGGTVDTVALNQAPRRFDTPDRRAYAELLHRLGRAVGDGDLGTVGAVATRSGELSGRWRSDRTFDRLRTAATQLGAHGVVVTHSGTMLALLLGDDDPRYAQKLAAARRACLTLAGNVHTYHTLNFDGTEAGPADAA